MTISSPDDSQSASTFPELQLVRPAPLAGDPARAVFGQVMGLVALTIGFTALGADIGRNLSGGVGILFFIAALASVVGLQLATARGREQLAIGLLFALGRALGLAVAPVIAVYAKGDPAAYGRRPAPRRRQSRDLPRPATPRGATCPAGRAFCSGRSSR